MATCPNGHTSQATDYCDVCGERMGASAPASGGGTAGASGTRQLPSRPAGGTPCPDCGTPAVDRFCEECGYDFATGGGQPTPSSGPVPPPITVPPPPPPPPPPVEGVVWTAVVSADRDYYDTVMEAGGPDSASLAFPPYAPERRIPLTGSQARIGRRSSSQPTPPEIDLREPPEDPGVSHVHAVLLAKPDGTWTLVDPGSTNRTCLNGSTEPIPLNVEVPLSDGDRIHVGAWTTITLTRGEAT